MNKETIQRLQGLFDQLIDKDEAERERLVADLMHKDSELAGHLIRLLQEDEKTNHLTAQPLDIEPAQLLEAHEELERGSQLGDFVIVKRLASGGMGTVYLAHHRDEDIEHQVAIKMIRTDRMDEITQQRFRLECGVLAQLRHPHIGSLISTGVDEQGSPYLVMEYVEGLPVDEFCKQEGLSRQQVLKLFRTVCRAVEHAHRNLIVHRDLKPANIRVTPDGIVKLLDFGIAKPLTARVGRIEIEQTATHQRLFSPSHVAPEQLRGESVDLTCDIYSLGVLLFQLLSDQLPFDVQGKTFSEFEQEVLHKDPRPPSLLNAEVPRDLDSIVLRCLRKSPESRYRTVSELVDDIDRLRSGQPVKAHQGQFGYVVGKFFKRHWLSTSVATATLTVFALLAIGLYQQYLEADYQNERAQNAIEVLTRAFESVDPSKSLGADITARQILDQSVRLLNTEYADDPALRAELLMTIGSVEMQIGEYSQADELLQVVGSIFAAGEFDDAQLRQKQLYAQAWLRLEMHESDTAIELADQALALAHSPSDALGLNTIKMKAVSDKRDYDSAIEQGKKIQAELLGQLDATDDRRWFFLLHYGNLLRVKGHWDDAAQIFEQVVKEQLAHMGDDHPDVASSRLQLFNQYKLMKRFDEAEALLPSIQRAYRTLYDENSIQAAELISAELGLDGAMGKTTAEERLNRQLKVLDIYQSVYGDEHPKIAMMQFNRGLDLFSAERPAEEWTGAFQEAIRIANEAYEPDHRNRLFFRCIYSLFLTRKKLFQETLDVLSEGFEIADRVPDYKVYDFYNLALLANAISSFALTGESHHQDSVDGMIAIADQYLEYTEEDFLALLAVAREVGMDVPGDAAILALKEEALGEQTRH